MNPSTVFATVLVDELVRCGVREAVLSPGSRNAPLSFALHAADAGGWLRLHVRVDERSAAFLALGLAKASGAPVPVCCTSGTAAANLHPAVLEAAESGVPLLLLTADRPPELRGAGANQTVDQVKLYGDAVRLYAEIGTPELPAARSGSLPLRDTPAATQGRGSRSSDWDGSALAASAYWRTVVDRALAAATGALTGDPGPVHLNLPLRDPLTPDSGAAPPGRPGGAPWTHIGRAEVRPAPIDPRPARTLVVAGDAPGDLGAGVVRLAEAAGWPVLAEPSSGARAGDHAVTTYPLLLAVPGLLDELRPERVLAVGRPTLTRAVQALLRDPAIRTEVRAAGPRWADAGRQAASVALGLPAEIAGAEPDPDWLHAWVQVEARARAAVDAVLDGEGCLSGLRVARDLARTVPAGSLVLLGSSLPVRDFDIAAGDLGALRVLANRGVAGIDGTVATAVGAALAHQLTTGGAPAYAVVGDLTLLHDANGLVIGPGEPRPDLTIVVVDNDGGGIFGLLEQGAPEHEAAFERVFGTPHGTDLQALCAATRTSYTRVDTPSDLAAALRPGDGIRVVHVRTDRRQLAAQAERLRTAVAAAVRP